MNISYCYYNDERSTMLGALSVKDMSDIMAILKKLTKY